MDLRGVYSPKWIKGLTSALISGTLTCGSSWSRWVHRSLSQISAAKRRVNHLNPNGSEVIRSAGPIRLGSRGQSHW